MGHHRPHPFDRGDHQRDRFSKSIEPGEHMVMGKVEGAFACPRCTGPACSCSWQSAWLTAAACCRTRGAEAAVRRRAVILDDNRSGSPGGCSGRQWRDRGNRGEAVDWQCPGGCYCSPNNELLWFAGLGSSVTAVCLEPVACLHPCQQIFASYVNIVNSQYILMYYLILSWIKSQNKHPLPVIDTCPRAHV
jgi:hypothetical protein